MRTVADGGKDYHLTRSRFHAEMLGNLDALRVLRNVAEDDLMSRLTELRDRFGSVRLGRSDFHTWLGALVQRHVGRSESDLIFDSFDDNHSGGVDEEEFIMGLQSILYGRIRSRVLFVRQLLGDVRATAGTIMSSVEAEDLLGALKEFAARKFDPAEVERAVDVARRQVKKFEQQYQIPTAEFCRALEVSPLIAHVIAIMRDDATLPPSPTPPPTPDPARDIDLLPRAEAQAEEEQRRLKQEAALRGEESANLAATASMSPLMSDASASFSGSPQQTRKKQPKKAKPAPVLSKLDTTHPGFHADEFLSQSREQAEGVFEHDGPEWFIRNGSVWLRTELMGEVPIE